MSDSYDLVATKDMPIRKSRNPGNSISLKAQKFAIILEGCVSLVPKWKRLFEFATIFAVVHDGTEDESPHA